MTNRLAFYLSSLSAMGIGALLLLSPFTARAALDANTVATVDGKTISKDEFERRYKESLNNFKFVPPTKANVLNDIINFELGAAEAKRQGLDKNPVVQERINAVLYESLVESALGEKFNKVVNVSDAEAKAFCQKNPEIRTSHIFVPLKTAALKAETEEAQKKIHAAAAALKSGKKFEQVVTQYSSGFATATGGDIGFQTRDKLDPAYYAAALKLSMNGVSAPVRSQYGLHIIKLTGKKSCNEVDLPEFKRMVFDERRMAIFSDYLKGLRSKAKVSINEELVKE